jgi:hypothetical protein
MGVNLQQTGGGGSGSGAVSSVFGRTGAVTAEANDYAAVANVVVSDGSDSGMTVDTSAGFTTISGNLQVNIDGGSQAQLQLGDSAGDPVFYLISGGGVELSTNSTGTVATAAGTEWNFNPVGTVLAPTASTSDNSTKVATTAYVQSNLNPLPSTSTAATQAQQNNSTKVATTAYVDSYEISAVSGLTYFWGAYGPFIVWAAGTAGAAQTANQANAWLFYVPFATTVNKATIYVNAVSASASQFASVGLYSTSGALVVNSGTINVSAGQATGARTVTISPGVAINPGFYYYVFTTNSSDATFNNGVAANNQESVMNKNGNRVGKGTATTNGALNSPLGSVTVLTGITPVIALFES